MGSVQQLVERLLEAPGPVQFRAWLGYTGLTQTQAGDLMGIAQGNLTHLLSGARIPRAPRRLRIQEVTGIDPEAWDRPLDSWSPDATT